MKLYVLHAANKMYEVMIEMFFLLRVFSIVLRFFLFFLGIKYYFYTIMYSLRLFFVFGGIILVVCRTEFSIKILFVK